SGPPPPPPSPPRPGARPAPLPRGGAGGGGGAARGCACLLLFRSPSPAEEGHRVGIFFSYVATDPLTEEMRQAFRDLGYFEGRTIAIEWRHIGGDTARLPALVADLVQLELAGLIAIGDRAIRAAREATKTTP